MVYRLYYQNRLSEARFWIIVQSMSFRLSPPPPPFRSMEFPRSEDLLEDRVSHELDTLLVTMRLERSCADTINCNGGFDERIKLRKGDGI